MNKSPCEENVVKSGRSETYCAKSASKAQQSQRIKRGVYVQSGCDTCREAAGTSSLLEQFAGSYLHWSGCFGSVGLATNRRTQQGPGRQPRSHAQETTQAIPCLIVGCGWREPSLRYWTRFTCEGFKAAIGCLFTFWDVAAGVGLIRVRIMV